MPNYNVQVPPFSLSPGDVAFAFNAESPTPPQASQQFALPSFTGAEGESGRTVGWQASFASAPTSVNVVLQAADVDADASYATIDTSTQTAGERRQVFVRARFIRAKLTAQSSGGAVTLTIGV